jgi:ribonuclease HI
MTTHTVRITDDLIRAGMSGAGGWTREQLAIPGVGWPPQAGWRKRVIGTEIASEQAERFTRLKRVRTRPPAQAVSLFSEPPVLVAPTPLMPTKGVAVIQFDGSCEGNGTKNATGKWGFRLKCDGLPDAIGSGITRAELVTNNVSEWQGLLAGLRQCAAVVNAGKITVAGVLIQGDSQLVIKCLSGEWRSKNAALTVYCNECRDLLAQINRPWHAAWIPRDENEFCDSLTR